MTSTTDSNSTTAAGQQLVASLDRKPSTSLADLAIGMYVVPEVRMRARQLLAERCDTPTARWWAVAREFDSLGGEPLVADEGYTEPLWEGTYPSVEMTEADADEQYVNAECAKRVAAAIAVMAYGLASVAAEAANEVALHEQLVAAGG